VPDSVAVLAIHLLQLMLWWLLVLWLLLNYH
jgi:hypothetical protein